VTGGSGPLVVLLHGFPNTWYAWRQVLAQLARTHIQTVRDNVALLTGQPGFRSFRLLAGVDGRSSAVVAEWAGQAASMA
jgi:heme-degrading monooxygenase HmoA